MWFSPFPSPVQPWTQNESYCNVPKHFTQMYPVVQRTNNWKCNFIAFKFEYIHNVNISWRILFFIKKKIASLVHHTSSIIFSQRFVDYFFTPMEKISFHMIHRIMPHSEKCSMNWVGISWKTRRVAFGIKSRNSTWDFFCSSLVYIYLWRNWVRWYKIYQRKTFFVFLCTCLGIYDIDVVLLLSIFYFIHTTSTPPPPPTILLSIVFIQRIHIPFFFQHIIMVLYLI